MEIVNKVVKYCEKKKNNNNNNNPEKKKKNFPIGNRIRLRQLFSQKGINVLVNQVLPGNNTRTDELI